MTDRVTPDSMAATGTYIDLMRWLLGDISKLDGWVIGNFIKEY